jgi:hypothetical protein
MWPFSASSGICVYDWSLWKPMLIKNIAPDARGIRAKFQERPERLLRRLPRGTDCVVVHLDISDNGPFIANPREWARVLTGRGIKVLNLDVQDIRKRTVQAACVAYGLPSLIATPDGPGDELLIVKTNLNSGGVPEQTLTARQRARFDLPREPGRINSPKEYFVSPRANVAPEIWKDPELVVERYLTNAAGRFFRIYILHSAVVISEGYSQDKLKRMGRDVRRKNHWLWREGERIAPHSGSGAELPVGLLRTLGIFAARFHVDYAAIDIIESATGTFHIIDVNKTPYWGSEHQPGLLEHMRLGLRGVHTREGLSGPQTA